MNLDVDGITNPSTGWAASSSRVRSNHVAYYYPSALATNLDGANVACAASGVALRTITYSDSVSFLWFAPAGIRRGLISGISELGYVSGTLGAATSFIPLALNPGERDALYQYAPSGDINPLVFFPGQGFVVWGQKTSASAASALDRVNVERLMLYIKRQLRRNTLSFVFQPNDTLTRDNLKAVVDNFLGDLVVKRGLYDFVTVCDESNNTPDRIDRNEMYIDVAVKPVKAAEFIYIPIRIVATGAEI
jgi:phage tail sheath protein FI